MNISSNLLSMKRLHLFVIILLIVSCKMPFPDPVINIGDSGAEVHFTRKITQSDLDQIAAKLKTYNVIIEFIETKFDGGNLSKISFIIGLANGNKGQAATNFVNLRGRPFGFRIKYDGSVLIVGEL